MWKEVPNSPLISIERKKKNLIGYAVECINDSGQIEARSCVFNSRLQKFTHVFTGMKNLNEACTAVELAMKIHRPFVDED